MNPAVFGYIRVSQAEGQSGLATQPRALNDHGLRDDRIFTDVASGRNMRRFCQGRDVPGPPRECPIMAAAPIRSSRHTRNAMTSKLTRQTTDAGKLEKFPDFPPRDGITKSVCSGPSDSLTFLTSRIFHYRQFGKKPGRLNRHRQCPYRLPAISLIQPQGLEWARYP